MVQEPPCSDSKQINISFDSKTSTTVHKDVAGSSFKLSTVRLSIEKMCYRFSKVTENIKKIIL